MVKFNCLEGYHSNGSEIYKCSGGKWEGGPYSCTNKCSPLESPDHGKRLDDSYEVGHVIKFVCDTGYHLSGSNKLQCQPDLTWKPANTPLYKLNMCPDNIISGPGKIVIEKAVQGHGTRSVYGTIFRVQCDDGYMINGPVRIRCLANGQWSEIPKCSPVTCASYPGLNGKCVKKTNLVLNNTLLVIHCTDHSTSVRQSGQTDLATTCTNNTWDDLSIRCYCDCEVKPQTDLVIIDNVNFTDTLKHNNALIWSCKNESVKSTDGQLICHDGILKSPMCKYNDTMSTKNDVTVVLSVVCVLSIILITFAIFMLKWKRKRICFMERNNDIEDHRHTEVESFNEEVKTEHSETTTSLGAKQRSLQNGNSYKSVLIHMTNLLFCSFGRNVGRSNTHSFAQITILYCAIAVYYGHN